MNFNCHLIISQSHMGSDQSSCSSGNTNASCQSQWPTQNPCVNAIVNAQYCIETSPFGGSVVTDASCIRETTADLAACKSQMDSSRSGNRPYSKKD